MRFRRKPALLTVLGVISLVIPALLASGCSGTADNTETTEAETQEITPSQMPEGDTMSPGPEGNRQFPLATDNMEELAGMLGIEAEVLEDAFSEAMSEMTDADMMPSGDGGPGMTPPGDGEMPDMESPDFEFPDTEHPEGTVPDTEFPGGERPEGMSPDGRSFGMSDEVLARVAEILNIDEQELKDAYAQLQEQLPGTTTS